MYLTNHQKFSLDSIQILPKLCATLNFQKCWILLWPWHVVRVTGLVQTGKSHALMQSLTWITFNVSGKKSQHYKGFATSKGLPNTDHYTLTFFSCESKEPSDLVSVHSLNLIRNDCPQKCNLQFWLMPLWLKLGQGHCGESGINGSNSENTIIMQSWHLSHLKS